MHLKCSTPKQVRSRSRVTETRLIRLYNNLINTVKCFINYKNVVYQNIILGAAHYDIIKKIPPKPCESEQFNLITHVTQSNQIKIGHRVKKPLWLHGTIRVLLPETLNLQWSGLKFSGNRLILCSFKKCRLFPLLSDDPAVQSIIQLLIVNFGILSPAKRGLVEE